MSIEWTIVGQGLAGTCLAWEFWKRGVSFRIVDRENGGSSRVAAGLINPVTGKHFEPSTRVSEFLPVAVDFYETLAERLSVPLWYPLAIWRLAASEKEWAKMMSKAEKPEIQLWLAGDGQPLEVSGWLGGYELRGGGRLDTRVFLDQSRRFFEGLGCYERGEMDFSDRGNQVIWCEGASGLMRGGYGAHRCAKGEILTLKADHWGHEQIRIGAGGWLVPLGGGLYKVGSTYEWNLLDEQPTEGGRDRVEGIAASLGGRGFEVVYHEAGIRPIMRRSEPWIGPLPNGGWMLNGLGSKGSLYAPRMAVFLADWLLEGVEPEEEYDFRLRPEI